MTLSLGRHLRIRAMVHVAGEPIPFFWPMRTFIHHNPLHGLEHLPFTEAVAQGGRLFQARGYLPRSLHQRYLAAGQVDTQVLSREIRRFVEATEPIAGLDLERLLAVLLEQEAPLGSPPTLADAPDIQAALAGLPLPPRECDAASLGPRVLAELDDSRPFHVRLDRLFGTHLGQSLDELVIESCLDFFDEGQSVWQMPGRSRGLFAAWRAVARHNLRLFIRGLHIKRILDVDDTSEGIISHVMEALGIPEEAWTDAFTGELSRLHGWAGFIRWRAGAKHDHWSALYPADLVDYLAIRLVLGLALLREHKERDKLPGSLPELLAFVQERPGEAWLRLEFHGRRVLPEFTHQVEDALCRGRQATLQGLLAHYCNRKREHEATRCARRLHGLAARCGQADVLARLDASALARLCDTLARFEAQEGAIWLAAEEAHYMARLAGGLNLHPAAPRLKRPFAQALFCIDVRSERIRRHLERVGDYQTFGIAGFFGVPLAFIAQDKGSETHLCPVVVTPRNLVLELGIARKEDDHALLTVLEQVFHDLKASVLPLHHGRGHRVSVRIGPVRQDPGARSVHPLAPRFAACPARQPAAAGQAVGRTGGFHHPFTAARHHRQSHRPGPGNRP